MSAYWIDKLRTLKSANLVMATCVFLPQFNTLCLRHLENIVYYILCYDLRCRRLYCTN